MTSLRSSDPAPASQTSSVQHGAHSGGHATKKPSKSADQSANSECPVPLAAEPTKPKAKGRAPGRVVSSTSGKRRTKAQLDGTGDVPDDIASGTSTSPNEGAGDAVLLPGPSLFRSTRAGSTQGQTRIADVSLPPESDGQKGCGGEPPLADSWLGPAGSDGIPEHLPPDGAAYAASPFQDRKAPGTQNLDASSRQKSPTPTLDHPLGTAQQVARVLLVDDALTIRRYHGSITREAGYAVAEAADGAEGLERALSDRFDLFLVDVNMPIMDGYRFLAEIRQRPELSATPAIMISTESGHEDRRLAYAAGANIYLVKPVAPDLLKQILHLLLGQATHV